MILTTYHKATEQGIPLHNIQTLIDICFKDWHKEYTDTVTHYHRLCEALSQRHMKELIQAQKKKALGQHKTHKQALLLQPFITLDDNPIQELAIKAQKNGTPITFDDLKLHYTIEENPLVKQKLEQTNFQFSEKTRQRVTNEIHDILNKSQTEGIGPRQVGHKIQEKFSKLKGYEAERIARTEINRANNTYNYEQLINDNLIDYYQWLSTKDNRTRGQHKGDKANHIKMNGEIVRKGEAFSNGLMFPGDPNGPAYETINCRCTLVPYIIPWDKLPPSKTHFKESDLVDKPEDPSQTFLLETLENTRLNIDISTGGFTVTPPDKQHLTKLLQELFKDVTKGKITNTKQLQTTLDEVLQQPEETPKPTETPRLSKEEVDKLSFDELADYYDLEYDGVITYEYDDKKYHQFIQKFDESELKIFFEEGAVKSYTKKGIATPNEIIQEVCRAAKANRMETNEIWFKNTNHGINHKPTKTGYDSLAWNVGGYNSYNKHQLRGETRYGRTYDDVDHRIVINPKYFKGGGKGKYAFIWEQKEGKITAWKHTIRHEFAHSGDISRKRWNNADKNRLIKRLCHEDEYWEIHQEERYFTEYANTVVHESYAEHGGYVDLMLDCPEEQTKTIAVEIIEDGKLIRKDINFEEYKEMYPKHYEFFKKLREEGLPL